MRTLEQLRERIAFAKAHDVLGLAIDDLLAYDASAYGGNATASLKLEDAVAHASDSLRAYLPFACHKALNHRGISASRAILHLHNWLWLMERGDLLAFAEDEANYKQYGVPILKHVAHALGVPLPDEIERWQDGEACQEHCRAGCNV